MFLQLKAPKKMPKERTGQVSRDKIMKELYCPGINIISYSENVQIEEFFSSMILGKYIIIYNVHLKKIHSLKVESYEIFRTLSSGGSISSKPERTALRR